MSAARRSPPNTPKPAEVQAVGGVPRIVDGERVETIRNEWLIEDKWWTPKPVRRRYWEVLTTSGGCLVIFRDLETHEWHRQAG